MATSFLLSDLHRLWLCSALVSAFWTCCRATAADSSSNTSPYLSRLVSKLPPHPRLLLNPEGVAALKRRIASAPWAKASWEELKDSVDASLTNAIALPPRGGNWSHNYVCPSHGARLSQGRAIGTWKWEHLCPVGHHILRGDPSEASRDFDGNAISAIHSSYAQQVVNAGLLFQVTGELSYAQRAREILLAYAANYLHYPLHDNQGKQGAGGHVASQSLSEASWLIDIAQGADLVWGQMEASQRHLITEQLLRPSLDQVILPHRYGIHNIQCRQNSAIGLVGFLLGDATLLTTALDDPKTGFHQQIEQGVLADGLWLEGSSGYHFFTIAGLWPLAEAARNCGLNLYNQKLQNMWDGPMALAMPDLVLPNFNDSGTVPLQNSVDYYELAYTRFHNRAWVSLLAKSARRGRLALLFGDPDLPRGPTPAALANRNLSASGYAILQKGNDQDATWLCLKYGPHGGGHGHPDKNSFILYSHDRILAPDAGTHAYGSPLHKDWDKTTLAHNTLVVDQSSQKPATGKCIAFGSESGTDYSITDAGPIYEGVRFVRTAALVTPHLLLFVDQVHSDAPHIFDLAYHQVGAWEAISPEAQPEPWFPPSVPGYARLSQVQKRSLTNGQLVVQGKIDGTWRTALVIDCQERTEILTGLGILKTTEDLAPVLIQRRQGMRTAFVWALSIDGDPADLKVAAVPERSGNPLPQSDAVLVELTSNDRRWSVLVNPQRKEVVFDSRDGISSITRAPINIRSSWDRGRREATEKRRPQ